ncbi:MAG: zinc ribbon domain-containing protein [Nanoarchaeota archaeon]
MSEKCPRCRAETKKEWNYCPECGYVFSNQIGFNIFSDKFFDQIFTKMRNQMKDMDKVFDKEFEVRDLTPLFKNAQKKGSGFTIKIVRENDSKPKISIKPFGNVNKEDITREISEHLNDLGIEQPIASEITNEPKKEKSFWPFGRDKFPKTTEEPKAEVVTTPVNVSVDVKLPDVKEIKDIEVKDLENSIEVKAVSGDKAYFKILTKPSQFRLKSKTFEKGVLHLEFA